MYRVMMTHSGEFLDGTFASLRVAKRAGKDTGTQFTVYDSANRLAGTWHPIHGWITL